MKSHDFSRILALLFFVVLIAGCGKKASEIEQGTSADTGALVVDSSPGLAEVYIGEEYKGDTPVTLYNLPVGSYGITIKKEGYEDFSKTATVKAGRTAEIDAELNPLAPSNPVEEKPETEMPENISAPVSNKVNLSAFAMYYDFEKFQFTEIRTDKSDLFSRKYETYVNFQALTPAKMYLLNKPIAEVTKEDCIFSDSAVANMYSGQTLCVKTIEGNVVAIGGNWQEMPTELEWKMLG